MRRFASVDGCARWLFAALGIAAAGCSGDTESSTSSKNPYPCKDPQPVVVAGQDTGVDSCGTISVRRREKKTCPEAMPRANPCSATQMNCTADTDCAAQAHGFCSYSQGGGGAPSSCNCAYGCADDSECPAGQLCLCGDPVGRCVPATCSTGADCGPGFDCISPVGQCYSSTLTCQTAKDECSSAEDCALGEYCGVGPDGNNVCKLNGCAGLGRPFLVEGRARLADVVARRDYAEALQLDLVDLTLQERVALTEHWTRVGLMEHASVAAFARFTLQLLGLGAPMELVERSNAAQADETAHTSMAFALASAYAGSSLGPSALDLAGALPELDLRRVLADTIREGCVGETLAAVEAEHASKLARDPMLREALERVAADETRHAELAWRFVRWAAETGGDAVARFARAELDAAIREALAEPLPASDAAAAALQRFGLVPARERAELRRDAAVRIVRACARELLGESRVAHNTAPGVTVVVAARG